MWGRVITVVAAVGLSAGAVRAQDGGDGDTPGTAQRMIEVEREAWRPPGARRRCPAPKPGEIVVCAREPEDLRVESPTDEAIRKGEAVHDGVPRPPNVFGLPPCSAYTVCARIGRAPEPPLLVDLRSLPEPLAPEEAALVFRAEDAAPSATPAAASPAGAP